MNLSHIKPACFNSLPLKRVVALICYLLVIIGSDAAAAEAPKPAAAVAAPAPVLGAFNPTNSTFTPGGKDPFFPDRVVVRQAIQTSTTTTGGGQTQVAVVKRDPKDFLNLKITGLIWGRRPMVSVNTVDFFQGARGVIVAQVPDERNIPQPKEFKVTCLEITKKSAKILVEGETSPRILYYKDE